MIKDPISFAFFVLKSHIIYTLTVNLERYLIMLISIGMVAISGLIVLSLVEGPAQKRLSWPLLYFFTTVNVFILSLFLY